ncbi:class I SAM-dependent DNA methyltransferase [Magnetospirillum sp. SS-4]|uniref:class I SAM-dependent DNA methyltransferase n=1 Tax=Magnetospirillum sp. SS-4 TaxID=2681465 RepID=UPI001574683F|nr:class I SAM-dependent DNA methyltransferase [Magnetospirillum sp. SS-4]
MTDPSASLPPVTLPELESHLWEAANILRGSPVDRTDWKSYILPLLFFKRVCDVWDEEHAAMLGEYGADFADEHRFQVPDGCHWQDVREAPRNVGNALANAMRGIKAANQKHLYGVFGDAQWTNKDRLPDELLKDLIEHFSALPLGNERVASDVIGDAYEYLIKQFADSTNKKAGEFYTPRSVVRLMVDTDRDRLKTFDVVLANPPYSIKQWNREAWSSDAWGRNFLGTPPQGRADYAFFQHILKSLDSKTGRCAILFPHGVLFRKEEAELRRKLVEADLVECVLGLGPNLFYNSPMEACVVFCRTNKPSERHGKVLLIDAVNEVARERAVSFLKPEHQTRIEATYAAFAPEPGFAALVTIDEIAAQGWSLSIPLYVKRPTAGASAAGQGAKSLTEAWAEWESTGRSFWIEMDAVVDMLDGLVGDDTVEAANG